MPFSRNYLHTSIVSGKGRVLNIDSDIDTKRAIHLTLLEAGFEVVDANGPDEAIAMCGVVEPDVLLLKLGEHEKAVGTCHMLRREAPLAALVVLSGNQEPNQIAEALDAGADYFLGNSVYLPELIARLRAALRYSWDRKNQPGNSITIGDIRLEFTQRMVYKSGQPLRLSPKEFILLHHMMANAGVPIPHEALIKVVWGAEQEGRIDYLRSLVRQLRLKLDDSNKPQYLLTDSWIGYRFSEAVTAAANPHKVNRAA